MTATVAIVEFDWDRGLQLRTYPMGTVADARAEHGRTLADARAFVLDVACTECGTEAHLTQPCADCGVPTCGCNPHSHREDLWFCPGCTRQACQCRECQPDDDYYTD